MSRRLPKRGCSADCWTHTRPAPGSSHTGGAGEEPTFRELATDWFTDRRANPAIRPRTVEHDLWQLTRYLLPFFGELRPSQITPATVKKYRRQIHDENAHIRAAADAGKPLRDQRGQPLRALGNRSINTTLRTLAAVLDEAEDAGWVSRNVARGRRMREPVERSRRDVLEPDELVSLLEAADELDRERHKPITLERADTIRMLRDELRMPWKQIATRVGVAETTAMYLNDRDVPVLMRADGRPACVRTATRRDRDPWARRPASDGALCAREAAHQPCGSDDPRPRLQDGGRCSCGGHPAAAAR
jgi:hypothetical protein